MFETRIGLDIHVAATGTTYVIDTFGHEFITSANERFLVVIGPEADDNGDFWGWTWSEYAWNDLEDCWELTATDGYDVTQRNAIVEDLAALLNYAS